MNPHRTHSSPQSRLPRGLEGNSPADGHAFLFQHAKAFTTEVANFLAARVKRQTPDTGSGGTS
ncbi:hypothetical protein [Streptomyces pseudoechinosporeus]